MDSFSKWSRQPERHLVFAFPTGVVTQATDRWYDYNHSSIEQNDSYSYVL